MKLSLVIPIYNEASHLKDFLTSIDNLELPVAKELVFVDDCSSDGSRAILQQFPFRSQHTIVLQEANAGKGAALIKGFAHATGDFIGVQDADFEYEMKDLPALLEPLLQGRADVVYGSRFKKSGEQVHRTFHYLVNRFLTVLSNLCTGLYLTDMETCYKLFRRDIIKNLRLESQRFGFEPEITAKVARLKVRIFELPISYYPRNYMQGKKISWKDGVAAIRHIFYFNLLVKPTQYIGEGMPKEYIPQGSQWL